MRQIPCDVLITSSWSSPGSTNVSLSSLMLDRADAVWNEMSGWPRYERETDNSEVLCPVGMEVITDNINSSCGCFGCCTFYTFCLRVSGSTGNSLCCSSLTFFSIYRTVAPVQILCKFLMIYKTCLGLNIAQRKRGMCSVIFFIFLEKKSLIALL